MEESDLQTIIAEIRRRSKRTRRFAQLSIVAIILVVAATLGFFFTTSQYTPNVDTAKQVKVGFLGFHYEYEDMYRGAKEGAEASGDSPTAEAAAVAAENARLREAASQRAFMINTIGSAILRIGSVFLAVYLIQIMVHLTRYHFRVADHLEALCDVVLIVGADEPRLVGLFEVFAPKHIEFGPAPSSMNDKALEVLRDAVKKIPTK